MKTALDGVKETLANSAATFSSVTPEQINSWEATTNIYIAKLMAMGGYTRNDIFQNIIAMFEKKGIVWNELIPAHHAALHDYLEDLIAEEVVQVATKIADNPFIVVGVDPAIVTLTDMSLEANSIAGSVPESLVSILRALS